MSLRHECPPAAKDLPMILVNFKPPPDTVQGAPAFYTVVDGRRICLCMRCMQVIEEEA